MPKGIIEDLQDRVQTLESQNASLQRQLFMLAAALGFDVVPDVGEPMALAEKGKTPITSMGYTHLGLVQRGSKLYRADDAPKIKAPKKDEVKKKLVSKELAGDDLDDLLDD